jgi:hypothetical protein
MTGSHLPPNPMNEPYEEPIEERESLQLDLVEEDSGRRSRSPPPDLDADFEKWFAQYPKRVAKATALKDYRAARKRATAEELLSGATRYAAERNGQDPKFTKHPSTWLNGGCWDDEPAQPIAATYNSSPPGRTDHIAVAEQLARQVMAKKEGGHVQ